MNHSSSSDNLPRSQRLAEQALSTLQRFLHVKAVSGGVLLVAAAAAMIRANFAHDYHALRDLPVTLGFGPYVFSKSVHFWVNDALMTLFFLVVGMAVLGLCWGTAYAHRQQRQKGL